MWLCTGVAETSNLYRTGQLVHRAILIASYTIAFGFIQKFVPLVGLKEALTTTNSTLDEFRSRSLHYN